VRGLGVLRARRGLPRADFRSSSSSSSSFLPEGAEIRGAEIRCQFTILARKDEPTPDYPFRKDELTLDYPDTGLPFLPLCRIKDIPQHQSLLEPDVTSCLIKGIMLCLLGMSARNSYVDVASSSDSGIGDLLKVMPP
jgi:hypothetical protein